MKNERLSQKGTKRKATRGKAARGKAPRRKARNPNNSLALFPFSVPNFLSVLQFLGRRVKGWNSGPTFPPCTQRRRGAGDEGQLGPGVYYRLAARTQSEPRESLAIAIGITRFRAPESRIPGLIQPLTDRPGANDNYLMHQVISFDA